MNLILLFILHNYKTQFGIGYLYRLIVKGEMLANNFRDFAHSDGYRGPNDHPDFPFPFPLQIFEGKTY